MEVAIVPALDAVADAVPDRECIVWRDRRISYGSFQERTRRFANVLLDHGVGLHGDPAAAAPWESAHGHVALYLTNCNEYLEGMLGAWAARASAFNVNYRYVAEELAYVLADAGTAAVVYHGRYAPVLAEVLPTLPRRPALLLQVDDESGHDLLPSAVGYEAALAGASPARPPTDPSADDLYIVYTGGTTGMPKGTLWRQADFVVSALNFRRRDGAEWDSVAEIVDAAVAGGARLRALPAPPLMHGAAHWNALSALLAGGTVVLQDRPDRLDPGDVLGTCTRERVTSLLIVGDAFARPLADELQAHRDRYDLSELRFLITGGATLSAALKQEWVELVPRLTIVDILGSSESGRQGVRTGTGTGTFERSATALVLSDDLTAPLAPGSDEIGWLAQSGRAPRGYLGDEAKTARTFPTIGGRRYVVAGDRARVGPDGSIELLGRESVTINTGGEKVFAEEVEHALKHHPAVYDALVVGRPSERWGQEVVAVVCVRPEADVADDDIVAEAARHIARYKLPKAIVRVDHVVRSPSGKPDYHWAARIARGDGV
jgi:fatty-acyl-CoA synthase